MMHERLRLLCGVLVLAAGLALSGGPVFALGTLGSSAPSQTRDSRFIEAQRAVQAKEWTKAVGLLERVVSDAPHDADAYNYLGYSQRKLGHRDKALASYAKALEIDPNHRGANEYLGELYLDMKDLPKAEERLARLSQICGPRCEEYRELHEQIDQFKSGRPRS